MMQIKVVRNGKAVNKRHAFIAKKHISTFEVTVRDDAPLSTENLRKALEKVYEVTGVKFIQRITIAA